MINVFSFLDIYVCKLVLIGIKILETSEWYIVNMKWNANDARRLKVYVHKTNKGRTEVIFASIV